MTFIEDQENKNCWRMVEDDNLDYGSEDDEVLSLCDLPLGEDEEDLSTLQQEYKHRSPDHELFEFFNDLNHEMLAAEDIVFCGKLLPHKPPPLRLNYQHLVKKEFEGDGQCLDFNREGFHCKSESAGECQSFQSNVKGLVFRNAKSLDCSKLQRASSSKTPKTTTSPSKEIGINGISVSKRLTKSDSIRRLPKRRWHLFMFGLMKPQIQMELSDMKNRQTRRSSSNKYPSLDIEKNVTVKRKDGNNGSWKLLRAIGCAGTPNTMVTSSLTCLPQE